MYFRFFTINFDVTHLFYPGQVSKSFGQAQPGQTSISGLRLTRVCVIVDDGLQDIIAVDIPCVSIFDTIIEESSTFNTSLSPPPTQGLHKIESFLFVITSGNYYVNFIGLMIKF